MLWGEVDGAVRYQLEEKAGDSAAGEYDSKELRYPITGRAFAKDAGSYTYRLRSCSRTVLEESNSKEDLDSSCGAWSEPYTVTVELPAVPANFAIEADASDHVLSASEHISYNATGALSWSAVTGAKSYIIEESSDGGANWSESTLATLSKSITKSLPASGTLSYVYRVKACAEAAGAGHCSSASPQLTLRFRSSLSKPASFALSRHQGLRGPGLRHQLGKRGVCKALRAGPLPRLLR